MALPRTCSEPGPVSRSHLDEVVAGTRVVGALIAESLAQLRPTITAPQWRVLVLASEGGCNVSAVAEDLGVHMSNATRTCDRLVAAGLLERCRAENDRRQVILGLTPVGRRLFDDAMDFRRARLAQAMDLMSEDERADLARSFTRLVRAAAQAKMTRRSAG